MSDRDDDVLELAEVREWVGTAGEASGDRRVALAIVLTVVGGSFALALLPHTLGAIGSEAVDTGTGIGAPNGDEGDAQQRYQNYVTNVALLFAPSLVVLVACLAAFVGAARTRIGPGRSRWRHVGVVAVAAGVGAALGYALFVLVGHLAFGEAAREYVVQDFPVTVRFGTLAVNALGVAVAAGIGGALAGGAGTYLADEAASPVDDAEPVPAGDDEPADAGTDDEAAGTDTEGATGSSEDVDSERPERVETARPASDYQETGQNAESDVPQYDPGDREWDGSGRD